MGSLQVAYAANAPPKREASSFYLLPKRHKVAVQICTSEELHDDPTVETPSQLLTTPKISKDIQQ